MVHGRRSFMPRYDRAVIFAIINDAEAYRGLISADQWH